MKAKLLAYVWFFLCFDAHLQSLTHSHQRIGAYQNNLIEEIIFTVFFIGGNKLALAEHTRDLFKPIPITTIAFVATSVCIPSRISS